jgi:hypothetical protein
MMGEKVGGGTGPGTECALYIPGVTQLDRKIFTTDEIARIQSGAGRKGELGGSGMARVGCAGVAM